MENVSLPPRQRAQVDYPNAELVSDKRILEIHDWARRYKKSDWPRPKKSKGKIQPALAKFANTRASG